MTAIVGITMLSMLALGAVRVASDSSDTDLLTGAPDGVTLALDNLTGGGERVFAAHWGGWFEFAVTDVSMFVDSRAEFFSDEIWHQYFSVLRVEDDWVEILDGWGVDVVVLSPGRTPQLFAALDGSPGWSRGYVDSEGAIFLRESLRQRVAGVPRSP